MIRNGEEDVKGFFNYFQRVFQNGLQVVDFKMDSYELFQHEFDCGRRLFCWVVSWPFEIPEASGCYSNNINMLRPLLQLC
jgi:hypothetical protein